MVPVYQKYSEHQLFLFTSSFLWLGQVQEYSFPWLYPQSNPSQTRAEFPMNFLLCPSLSQLGYQVKK